VKWIKPQKTHEPVAGAVMEGILENQSVFLNGSGRVRSNLDFIHFGL